MAHPMSTAMPFTLSCAVSLRFMPLPKRLLAAQFPARRIFFCGKAGRRLDGSLFNALELTSNLEHVTMKMDLRMITTCQVFLTEIFLKKGSEEDLSTA